VIWGECESLEEFLVNVKLEMFELLSIYGHESRYVPLFLPFRILDLTSR
jgi:hypothetical protein